jgi:non-specific serine/threonine protein kinase
VAGNGEVRTLGAALPCHLMADKLPAAGAQGRGEKRGIRFMDGYEARTIGELLRRYRDASGLTQEELAERTGLSSMAISLLERGERRRPQAYTVQKLAEALGLSPADRARFEAAARRSGGPEVPPAPGTPPHNLPLQLTSFIGTEQKLAQVKQLLASSRLLTLTGAGGVGKTRLALEVAAEVLGEYPNGVWFVELAPLADSALVPQAVASTLGVREAPGQALVDGLTDYLGAKTVLLLLDNCEHLIEATAQLADRLLRACPGLRVLATSREPLNMGGETAWRVPSLALPEFQPPPPLERLTQYEAVRLFMARAAAALPGFAVTNENAAAVAEICYRLDGIPLAIELAAARVKAFSAEQIRARLDDRFRLLTGGSRTAMPRQQTLRAAVDWSYDLLSEEERVLLNRLSVFAGGWTLEATEAIGAEEPARRAAVLGLLPQLVDKSLVLAHEEGGTERYWMLETIRQYAAEKLGESGEAVRARDRHLAYFLGFAEAAYPKLSGPDQPVWLERLEREHDNLRAALAWSLAGCDPEAGLQLAGALLFLWTFHSHLTEGRHWLGDLLRQVGESAASPPRSAAYARALRVASNLARLQGDYAAAQTYAEEAVAVSRELGDELDLAWSMRLLSAALIAQGDHATAQVNLEASAAMCRAGGDSWSLAMSLFFLGSAAHGAGDLDAAQSLEEECAALFRQVGDRFGLGYALGWLGELARIQGDYARAERFYQESMALLQELGDRRGRAGRLVSLGFVALHRQDYPLAASRFAEALAIARELGVRPFIFNCLAALAGVTGREDPNPPAAARAARLLGAAEALHESMGGLPPSAVRAEFDHTLAATRSRLDEAAFAAAWAEGRAMTSEEAIAYALEGSAVA